MFYWDNFGDINIGISQYQYKIVNTAQDVDVFGLVPTYNKANYGYALNLPVQSGDVLQIMVIAINLASLSTVTTSPEIAIDINPPICADSLADLDLYGTMDDVDFVSSLAYFRAKWKCWDQDSAISGYYIGVGTIPYSYDIISRREVYPDEGVFEIKAPPNLSPDLWYFVTIDVTDSVGWSTRGASDGILWDDTSPECYESSIQDGLHWKKEAYHDTTSPLGADWSGIWDPSSPISMFCYLIMEFAPNNSSREVTSWICVGNQTSTAITVSPLLHNHKYYFKINSTNVAGLMTSCQTKGVIVGQ
jgi:hypothetical protein